MLLHLREDAAEYADDYRLRSLVNKYSDHIAFPVSMLKPPAPTGSQEDDAEEPAAAKRRLNMKWSTPPRRCGLVPGLTCLRG